MSGRRHPDAADHEMARPHPGGKTLRGPHQFDGSGATFLAAAGLSEAAGKPLDGVNLLPFLNGEKTALPA